MGGGGGVCVCGGGGSEGGAVTWKVRHHYARLLMFGCFPFETERYTDWVNTRYKSTSPHRHCGSGDQKIGNIEKMISRFLSRGAAAVRNFVTAPCLCRAEYLYFVCARFLPSPQPRCYRTVYVCAWNSTLRERGRKRERVTWYTKSVLHIRSLP